MKQRVTRSAALCSLLVLVFALAGSAFGTPTDSASLDPATPTSAAAFAPVPVRFGPIVRTPLVHAVLADFGSPTPGSPEVTAASLILTHDADELRPLPVSLGALSFTAIYGEDDPTVVIRGQRIEPLRPERRSYAKPLLILFGGVVVMSIIAIFVPRLVTGLMGGGPAQRKGSRRRDDVYIDERSYRRRRR